MESEIEFRNEEIEESEVYKTFLSHCPFYETGFRRVQPGGQVMTPTYIDFHPKFLKFEPRDDDIWVASFPKSGTTWTQEMVWNIMNDVDIETAKKVNLDQRFPYVESSGVGQEFVDFMEKGKDNLEQKDKDALAEQSWIGDSLELVNKLPTDKPRLLKTHQNVALMPKQVLEKSKIIYVARNPRDVVLSFFNFFKICDGYNGTFSTFFDAFLEGIGPHYLPYFSHNIGWWNLNKEKENMMFLFYEDMKKDLKSVIRKVAKFLGKELSEEQIEKLNNHLSFDSMKNNTAVNMQGMIDALAKSTGIKEIGSGVFMKTGKAGGWRNKLTAEQIERMEAWEQKHLADTDLKFDYE